MEVEEASYDGNGSLQVSIRLDDEFSTLEEALTTGYVKLSVYERDSFGDCGSLTLYESMRK